MREFVNEAVNRIKIAVLQQDCKSSVRYIIFHTGFFPNYKISSLINRAPYSRSLVKPIKGL